MTGSLVPTVAAAALVAAGALGLASHRGAAAVVLPPPAAAAALAAAPSATPSVDTAVFAGGCFWGIEAVFEHLKGVASATSGYAGTTVKVASPSYEDVSTGETGYAEAVRVVYDPSQISYGQLMQVFFSVAHDPTQLNHQDPDVGPQYRSAIFYRTPAQQQAATAYIAQLTAAKTFKRPIVTQVTPLRAFTVAEAYHQDYLAHHPDAAYIVAYDAPKLVRLKAQFATIYR